MNEGEPLVLLAGLRDHHVIRPEAQVHIRVRLYILNHPGNRMIRLEWDSQDSEYGASELQLNNLTSTELEEGETGLKKAFILLTDYDFQKNGLLLTAGQYRIIATLTREDGDIFTKVVPISIVLHGGEGGKK